MSYTELIIFKDGKADSSVEYRNAWGGAARIWNSLFDAYVPKKHEYDSWICSDESSRRLWDLVKRKDLPLFERALMAFTFDLFYVSNKNLKRFVDNIHAFVEKYPANKNADHLPEWAKWLEDNGTVEAVGLYGTSVGENLWYRGKICDKCEQETDEREAVPLTYGSEVYEWLEAHDANGATTTET